MPYIKQEDRDVVGEALDRLTHAADGVMRLGGRDGAVNYLITEIVTRLIRAPGERTGAWRYADIAAGVGAFECAKLEFYRRIAGPKEDAAVEANGDIPIYAVSDACTQPK